MENEAQVRAPEGASDDGRSTETVSMASEFVELDLPSEADGDGDDMLMVAMRPCR